MHSGAMSFQDVSTASQSELLQAIPQKWRIEPALYSGLSDVSRVPLTCGTLSKRQIEITELTVTDLSKRIRSRELKAAEITEAFAARAAIAHQLVQLPLFDYEREPVSFLTIWDKCIGQLLDRLVLRGGPPARQGTG